MTEMQEFQCSDCEHVWEVPLGNELSACPECESQDTLHCEENADETEQGLGRGRHGRGAGRGRGFGQVRGRGAGRDGGAGRGFGKVSNVEDSVSQEECDE